jgi:chemotaxis protein CheD
VNRQSDIVVENVFLDPGYVMVPQKQTMLCAVVTSTIAVTLFDRRRKRGGMNLYQFPRRRPGGPSTPKFACPGIVCLSRMLLSQGGSPEDLEASIFGGADNPDAAGYVPDLHEENIRVGLEVLHKLGITDIKNNTGGTRARKLMFDSGTGETVVAETHRVRSSDWYPA